MLFRPLFDPPTSTYTYLLADTSTREAVIIDPVRDRHERDVELIRRLGLKLRYVLDTHVHADHVTAAGTLRRELGARTVVSRRAGIPCADLAVDDGDVITFGSHRLEVRATPGHTEGDVTYVCHEEGMAFTGDALLIGGCGRTDFQQGNAATLYDSIHRAIFSLPDETKIYPGHDYRGFTVSTVGEEKAFNARLGGGRSKEEFVAIMSKLDLAKPKHIETALPANLQCGGALVEGVGRKTETWAPVERTMSGVPEITPAWVREHAETRELQLVDVREPDEFAGGHIEGSTLVPLSEVHVRASAWNPNQPLITICRSGRRSAEAARVLETMGFTEVASMRGGIIDWQRAGYPTV